jgi:hypothetical protein
VACRLGLRYQRPNTGKAAAAHKVYPYLLGGLSDITADYRLRLRDRRGLAVVGALRWGESLA